MPKASKIKGAEAPKKKKGFEPATASAPELLKFLSSPHVIVRPFDPGGKAEIMARSLASQPKIKFIIPLNPLNKEKRGVAFETAQLNGVHFTIAKGVFVDVPQQVAELINEAIYSTAEALEQFSAEGKEALEEV